MTSTPEISDAIRTKVLTESGHRCAACGAPCPLAEAQIVPWRETTGAAEDDLLCLCADCHGKAVAEGWGEDVLREHKQSPWIHRQFDEPGSALAPLGAAGAEAGGGPQRVELSGIGGAGSPEVLEKIALFLDLAMEQAVVPPASPDDGTTLVDLPWEKAVRLHSAVKDGAFTDLGVTDAHLVPGARILPPGSADHAAPRQLDTHERQELERILFVSRTVEGTVGERGVITVAFPPGNVIDEANNAALAGELHQLVAASSCPRILMTFANVEHLSSAALGTLITLKRLVDGKNGELRLAEIAPHIYETFVVTKINQLFRIHGSTDEAAAAFE